MKIFIFIAIVLITVYYFIQNNQKTSTILPTSISNPTSIQISPTIKSLHLLIPIADFKFRITKKYFGTFVTPQNSPVSPEKFRGFHTGVDIEYGDILTEVPVKAVADGQIIYSGFVSGYGGFIAQQISINSQNYIAIYGHLRPSSLVKNNSKVSQGDQIGVLGTAYSRETDGERRHLHFALIKGSKLNFRGYVQNQSELSLWADPLTFYP